MIVDIEKLKDIIEKEDIVITGRESSSMALYTATTTLFHDILYTGIPAKKMSGYAIDGTFDYLLNQYDGFSLDKVLSIATKELARIF